MKALRAWPPLARTIVSRRSVQRRQSTAVAQAAPIGDPPLELLQIIQQHIRAHGPLPLPRYMSLCLQHPTLGYYTKQRAVDTSSVLGKSGDFITSPEISQVFGELLAIWFITQWQAQGSPARVRIIEVGPGKGTLMADMLRTFERIKAHTATLESVHLIDTSQHLRRRQKETLAGFHTPEITWHESLSGLNADDKIFTMVIAHEFFDALPIYLFERRQEGWREVMVDISSAPTGPEVRLAVSPGVTLAAELYTKLPRFRELVTPGKRAEICPDGHTAAAHVARLVAESGAALIIDYGDEVVYGDSFRAFKAHKLVDPFDSPGQADLTANVDFGWLKDAITPVAQSTPLLTQREFLLAMGLNIRVEQLLKRAAKERYEEIKSATDRLIDATTMGSQYKVLGIVPKLAAPPFPFSHLHTG